jgi:hypothetical protein
MPEEDGFRRFEFQEVRGYTARDGLFKAPEGGEDP